MVGETRYLQASPVSIYGAQSECSKGPNAANPRNPYALAKLYACWITVNYREAYGIHANNIIMDEKDDPAVIAKGMWFIL